MLGSQLGSLLQDLLFFGSDVQSTAIAVAITSSLCCSIFYLIFSFFSDAPQDDGSQNGTKNRTFPQNKKNPVVAFHTRRKSSHGGLRRRSSSSKSLWTNRLVEQSCNVPCIRCEVLPADKLCRFVLCATCCQANASISCTFHKTGTTAVQGLVEGACEHKPTEIDLSYLSLHRCPDRVGYMGAQLSSLNLSNNNLQILPEEIGFLKGLQELFLQYNTLSHLPESIGNLSQLLELDVKNNKLLTIPEFVGQMKSLTIFRLTNNLLTSIPSSIGNLSELDEFSAQSNELTFLPDEICSLRKLTVLYLGYNHLDRLPECFGQLVRLTELDLSNNDLEVLPAGFCNCAALNRLWLSHNRLQCLPGQFGRLQQLRELHLKNNQLQYLPASLTCLQLYTFSVGENPWILECDENKVHALITHPESPLPSLQEVAARAVVKFKVIWSDGDIPLHLEKKLQSYRECSSCQGPLLDYFQSEVTFKSVGLLPKLPLYQHICSPFPNASHCRLMPID